MTKVERRLVDILTTLAKPAKIMKRSHAGTMKRIPGREAANTKGLRRE